MKIHLATIVQSYDDDLKPEIYYGKSMKNLLKDLSDRFSPEKPFKDIDEVDFFLGEEDGGILWYNVIDTKLA